MSLHEHMWRQKSLESRLLIALIVIRNSAFYCDRNFWNLLEDSMVPKLLIALIVIRNLAFNCDRNFWNLKTCRHKKYGVKTFSCSHCDKKFGLFWQEFLKLEDMKTQTVWCQNAFSLHDQAKTSKNLEFTNPYSCHKREGRFAKQISNSLWSAFRVDCIGFISYKCAYKFWISFDNGNTNMANITTVHLTR